MILCSTRRCVRLFSPACPLFRRNDRQQQIRCLAAAKMKAGSAVKNGGRPVARVVMQEWAATLKFILEIGQLAAARTAVFVVLATNRQADAISGRNHD